MLCVVGAGAMGTALAVHCLRAGTPASLLATEFDEAVVDAHRRGFQHPALGVPIPAGVDCVEADKWESSLARAELVVVAVSSHGIREVVHRAAPMAALAPELVAGVPTAIVCASREGKVRARVRALLEAPSLFVATTDDVPGVETAAAYKNVAAIAVGMCEGLSERQTESVFVHGYANTRAAVFAAGVLEMTRLAT